MIKLKTISWVIGLVSGTLFPLSLLLRASTIWAPPSFNLILPTILCLGVVGALLVMRNLVRTGSAIMLLFGILISLVYPLLIISSLLIFAGILGFISSFREGPFQRKNVLLTIGLILIAFIIVAVISNVGYFSNRNKPGFSSCTKYGGVCRNECNENMTQVVIDDVNLCPEGLFCCQIKMSMI